MNKINLFSIIVCICIFFSACTKEKTKNSSSTQWTIYGTTYKSNNAVYDDWSKIESLSADDGSLNSVSVYFYTKPKINASFSLISAEDLVRYNGSTFTTKTAIIEIHANGSIYTSSGRSGDMVKATIQSNQKLRVEFSNVEFIGTSTKPTLASGIITEQ